MGGVALLKAVGFIKEGGSLELSVEARNMDLIAETRKKLQGAFAQYA